MPYFKIIIILSLFYFSAANATGIGDYFNLRFPLGEGSPGERDAMADRIVQFQLHTTMGGNGQQFYNHLKLGQKNSINGKASIAFLTGPEEQTSIDLANIFLLFMSEAQKRLDRRVPISSITLDPQNLDTEALTLFLKHNDQGERFIILSPFDQGPKSLALIESLVEYGSYPDGHGQMVKLPNNGKTTVLLASSSAGTFTQWPLNAWLNSETQIPLLPIDLSDVRQIGVFLTRKSFATQGLIVDVNNHYERLIIQLFKEINGVPKDAPLTLKMNTTNGFFRNYLEQIAVLAGELRANQLQRKATDHYLIDVFRKGKDGPIMIGFFLAGLATPVYETPAARLNNGRECQLLLY